MSSRTTIASIFLFTMLARLIGRKSPHGNDISDHIESTTDIVNSLVVWTGFKISFLPEDANHPEHHVKVSAMAGLVVLAHGEPALAAPAHASARTHTAQTRRRPS